LLVALPNLASSADKTHEVSLLDQAPFYQPGPTLKISVGDTITWKNPVRQDGAMHTVTEIGCFEWKVCAFDSGFIKPGESFSYTFRESGTYRYRCRLHVFMEGSIIVDQPKESGTEDKRGQSPAT
jgi:plastocyanin